MDDLRQLLLPTFQRCPRCGQIIRHAPPEDALGDTILDVLQAAGGRLVKMNILLDAIGMDVGRTTVWERLTSFEEEGKVARDPKRPKSGWRASRRLKRSDEQAFAA